MEKNISTGVINININELDYFLKSNMEKELMEAGISPNDKLVELSKDELDSLRGERCPVCGGGPLIKEGHCTYCYECGWSKSDL